MANLEAVHRRRANRRAAKRAKLAGVMVTILGGGGQTIGDQAKGKVEENRDLMRRREAHKKRWQRFLARWGSNSRFAWLCEDMRHWQLWQASLMLLRNDAGHMAWWFAVSGDSRMELADMGRAWRLSNRAQQRLGSRA